MAKLLIPLTPAAIHLRLTRVLVVTATMANMCSAFYNPVNPSFGKWSSIQQPRLALSLSSYTFSRGRPHITLNPVPATVAKSSPSTLLRHAQPNKGDLYSDDELLKLLNLHQQLNPEEDDVTFPSSLGSSPVADDDCDHEQDAATEDVSSIPSFHDLVLQTIDDIEREEHAETNNNENDDATGDDDCSPSNNDELLERKKYIRAIASDVDGTLLSSGQSIHPRTLRAVMNAIHEAYPQIHNGNNNDNRIDDATTTPTRKRKIQHFFPATGKSKAGAASSLGPQLSPLISSCPGVYLQGLYCVDAHGNVIFEKKLPQKAIEAAEDLVEEFGISIMGYDGDELYTTEFTEVVRSLSEYYGEPPCKFVATDTGSDEDHHILENDDTNNNNNDNKRQNNKAPLKLAQHPPGMHKLLLMDPDPKKLTTIIRPRLEQLAQIHGVTVTQAVPTMLELLPGGCSKADGVARVCRALGIDPGKELLAVGDAENDVGMLELAAIGVAVGNACQMARGAADFVMKEESAEGGAGLAMEMFALEND
ncbi:hypothetical protein ACHAXS_009213 [Conticribra weissflogii]